MRRVLFLVFAAVGISLSAQNIGVKTNLLYDLTSTINLGAEIGLAPKWTLDLSGNYNAWAFKNDKKWKHWMAQPEARYWFCEAFNGHFLGLHLLGGQFNVGNVDPIIYPSADCSKAHPDDMEAYINSIVSTVNRELQSYKKITKVVIAKEPLAMTSTKKVKRFEVEKAYKAELNK